MRILVAPDSFKGSLTSFEAAEAMVAGIKLVMPDVEIISMPLADGGEGTLDVLHLVYGGNVQDDMLYFSDRGASCALIESARLIGLTLPEMQADVFDRGSTKLGQTVLAALDAGVQDIRIALGGSATVDGGLGFLAALGCRVLNHAGEAVSPDLNGMMHACGFEQMVKTVDWVLTGEGKSDAQTLHGKLPAIVAAQARNHGAKTALISGMVEHAEVMKSTFDAVCFTSPAGVPVHEAMAKARSCLLRTTAQWADSWV